MFTFTRFSLARQFMLVSLLILLAGMVIIGVWVGRQIEIGVVNRTAAVTSLYVDSFVSPRLQGLSDNSSLEPEQLAGLNRLLLETSLGREIVAFKVWSPEGLVLYSPNQELIGRRFDVNDHIAQSLAGEVVSEISNLKAAENEYESRLWDELIETYLPVRAQDTGEVIAVAEFYQTPDSLRAEVQAAQLRSWLIVGAATVAMYILLAGLVGRASNTILAQQDELRDKVVQLSALLSQNRQLHERVRRAAARTTALNERFMRRISADLHDGPGQDLALALLRIEALAETCENCPVPLTDGRVVAEDFRTVRAALESGLAELRTISSGLRLPELEPLTTGEVTERAVRDYERKSGQRVAMKVEKAPKNAPMPTKITLYRVIQEALANGFRHAAGTGQVVRLWSSGSQLHVEILDAGEGFDPLAAPKDGHLGLAGMRERVQVLGGTFSVDTAPGRGVRVFATIQLDAIEGPE
ncbi:MAG: sensor histidine kinase [Anaerolineales bacterium]